MASRDLVERAMNVAFDAGIAGGSYSDWSRVIDAALTPSEDVAGVVERLRYRAKWQTAEDPSKLLVEAADLITSLSAKLAAVERERDEARLSAQTVGDQLGQAVDRLTRKLDAAEARASELQREGERLREALREIASHPEKYNDGKQSYAVGWAFHNVQSIARAALQQEGESDA